MKRPRPGGILLPSVYMFVFLATAAAILLVGPRTAFHQPLSAALNTDRQQRPSGPVTHLWNIEADRPESKRFKKRPLHPAVFDRHYFAWQKAVRMHQIAHGGGGASLVVRPNEKRFLKMILEIATRHGVDPLLIAAMVKAESSYDPRAVSPAGAAGLMQLMPATAEELGVANRLDPRENLHAGIRYYKRMLKRYNGDIELALAAYNAGMGSVRTYKGVPPFQETRQYIERVKTYYRQYMDGLDTDPVLDSDTPARQGPLSLRRLPTDKGTALKA